MVVQTLPLWPPTGAVEAAGQLSSHDLHDEADAQAQHVPEEGWLGADVHGQVHHDLLRGRDGKRRKGKITIGRTRVLPKNGVQVLDGTILRPYSGQASKGYSLTSKVCFSFAA